MSAELELMGSGGYDQQLSLIIIAGGKTIDTCTCKVVRKL